jgi:energy-coupling factor transporter ATP-binding protein EcfA2
MRWLKCDLQVQTPEDSRHWMDQDLRLGEPRRPKIEGTPNEQDIQEKARTFLWRCYELDLDLVGLTDHNFSAKSEPRDWFVVHLIEQNRTVAKEFDREPIIFLPGFEVDIGYHVLCLFAPVKKQRDFERCNKILTKLGMPEDARFEEGEPRQLRHNDQRVSLKKLVEIVQNEHDGIVITAHADQARGLFSDTANRDDYCNPDLYCVELTQNPPSQKHQEILMGRNEGWKRKHAHPAWIMSSDAKSIRQKDAHPIANSLGYRYTWIKMSEPSIESLRQAFLDHESRIILPVDVPSDRHPAESSRHAMVKSISIRNVVFLADQKVHFSPNMNCVIGGRGSGKSTLLEYLRIILGKDKTKDLDAGTRERIKRVRDTLNAPGAELEVCWTSADGVEDRIVWQNGSPMVHNRDLADPETFFNNLPIRFYSQQQLNRLTESEPGDGSVRQAQRLLELVDGFAQTELDELTAEERKLKQRIEESFSNLRKADELEKECKQLRQEFQELGRQWKARSEIQADARKHQQLKSESRYLENILGTSGKQFSDVTALAEDVAASHIAFQVENAPHTDWFKQYDDQVKTAKDGLAETIRNAVKQFENTVESLRTEDPEWPEIQEELQQADTKFQEACEDKGLTPDDVGHLQEISQSRANKQRKIEDVEGEIQRYTEAAGDPEDLMRQLHEVWKRQYQQRVAAADQANKLAVLKDGGKRFIEVSAKYQQDIGDFSRLWGTFAPRDGRTRLGRNWDACGKTLYELFIEQSEADSPWQLLQDQFTNGDRTVGSEFGDNALELHQHIQDNLERWEKLRCSRVQDTVDMKLFRADGSVAGSIAKGSLSDGQRNTAALALLLAQEGGPLVIDQPEDELDSNFVFRELIPMLRKVKSKRQLILATHNANLPVNGDAELIYAFEARNGCGNVLAQGGLDQASVTKAVLDIMEGTEEAFRRRREKYHF